MSLTFFNKPALPGGINRSRWLRGIMVVGLAFTVSACAYDSPYYSSRSGYSSYSGGHYGYYDRGHYHRNRYSKRPDRSEEHTSELQSLMRISYAVFCLKKKKPIQLNKLSIISTYANRLP